jgi:hypothetical protein
MVICHGKGENVSLMDVRRCILLLCLEVVENHLSAISAVVKTFVQRSPGHLGNLFVWVGALDLGFWLGVPSKD